MGSQPLSCWPSHSSARVAWLPTQPPDVANQVFKESQPTDSAMHLITRFGKKNGTTYEPSMLYYYNCVACVWCGHNFPYKVAELLTGDYLEYSWGCTYPKRMMNDNAYVC